MDGLAASHIELWPVCHPSFARSMVVIGDVEGGRGRPGMVLWVLHKDPPPAADLHDGEGVRETGGTRSPRVENDQPRSAEAQAPGLGDLGEHMFSL